jgi:hypothetical protein
MFRGLRQAIEIGREAFCLGAWRLTVGAHEQKLNTKKYAAALSFPNVYLLYNTVVLRARCKLGFVLNTQVHHCGDEPGIVGGCHLTRDLNRPALITQSPEQGGGCRCLPNLLDRLWFSLPQLRSCLHNKSRGDCPLCPGRLGCRRNRCRHRVVQRFVHFSTHPQPV